MLQGWQTAKLGEILAPKGYIRGPFGSALRRNELLNAGIPVYEQQHAIYGIRQFRFFISEEKFQEMKRFETKIDDLIISCSGTLGRVSTIKADDPKGIISQALLLLRANTAVVLPQYLQYFFSSKKGYDAIVSRSTGSVQVNISKRADIEQIPLMLPPICEQQVIVDTLVALEDKIENNTAINHHLAVTSATDSSPDIRRGKRASRKLASRADSSRFALICANNGTVAA
ncbi:restriction endonuclease subunit S [Lachnospiraceae bacterium ZAX-1]